MIETSEVLLGYYNAAQAMGDKSRNSDAMMLVEGHETISLLIKQFPWPVDKVAGEIEVAGPLGTTFWSPQQRQIAQQGPMALHETSRGGVQEFLRKVVDTGARFNAVVYEGSPDKFYRGCRIRDCLFVPDTPDRDWENRSTITMITGTLFFHWFGGDDRLPGNIPV